MADDYRYDPNTSLVDTGLVREQAAFKACLNLFDSDPEQAGTKYEQMRARLIYFFRRRRTRFPEDDADITLDRVCKKILEGEKIHDLPAYCITVARFVFLECMRDVERRPRTDVDDFADLADRSQQDDNDGVCLDCLDGCLAKLAPDQREMILAYYAGEGREKIEGRKKLAKKLRIPLNTLRLRAFRLRDGLSGCIRSCLESGAIQVRP